MIEIEYHFIINPNIGGKLANDMKLKIKIKLLNLFFKYMIWLIYKIFIL